MVCFCYSITREEVLQVIREEGARDVKRIGELTLAGTGCGACEIDLVLLLQESIGSSSGME